MKFFLVHFLFLCRYSKAVLEFGFDLCKKDYPTLHMNFSDLYGEWFEIQKFHTVRERNFETCTRVAITEHVDRHGTYKL